MALLEVKSINAGYGKKQVLYNVSFEIDQGDITLLIGSNGSGKSTLLKTIYGLIKPTIFSPEQSMGQIIFNGTNITNIISSQLISRGLIYIPQKNNYFETLTVKENLEVSGIALNNKKLFLDRYEQVLNHFTIIRENLRRLPMQMSGGERQILTLGMAFLHRPKLILMDEPFLGLAGKSIDQVKGELAELNKKQSVSILMVEHQIIQSISLTKKLIGLKLGRIKTIREINKNFNLGEITDILI